MFHSSRALAALICIACATALGSTAITSVGAQEPVPPAATPTPAPAVDAPQEDVVTPEEAAAEAKKLKRQLRKLRHKIRVNRRATWRWQFLSLKHQTRAKHKVQRIKNVKRLKRMAKWWHKRKTRARYVALHPPNMGSWFCIRSHEAGPEHGGWRANTGNGYYGGLQMDMTFQRMYGSKLLAVLGTANNWPWFSQMHVAERARSSGRGYYPWPRTARFCRLI